MACQTQPMMCSSQLANRFSSRQSRPCGILCRFPSSATIQHHRINIHSWASCHACDHSLSSSRDTTETTSCAKAVPFPPAAVALALAHIPHPGSGLMLSHVCGSREISIRSRLTSGVVEAKKKSEISGLSTHSTRPATT